MKSMKSMLAAGVLLASLCACKQAKEVTILSYNVHNCIGLDKVRDYERIARVINEAAPDVVAVQELDSATERNGGVYALAELEKLTGMNGIFASAISFQGGSYGIGLLSKEQPLKYKIVPMPGREEERALIVAEFRDYVFCLRNPNSCWHVRLSASTIRLPLPSRPIFPTVASTIFMPTVSAWNVWR